MTWFWALAGVFLGANLGFWMAVLMLADRRKRPSKAVHTLPAGRTRDRAEVNFWTWNEG